MEKQKFTIKKLSFTKAKISKLDQKHVLGGHQNSGEPGSHCPNPKDNHPNGNDGQNG
ncbi:hypothetical protein ABW636_06155 [Aquimarina sp. 2201CG1-2-11]|uniref:hypothetical protein n=1 Tax=Aquimarina discodermiae TaxID=3231043 RepID=UPI003461C9F8